MYALYTTDKNIFIYFVVAMSKNKARVCNLSKISHWDQKYYFCPTI